jgi:hypothetical protein
MKNLNITDLVQNEENPRLIKEAKFRKLVSSIKEFPEMLELRPIVVDENNVVLGGNMRMRAAQEAGLKKVPVIIAKDLTEKQRAEFIIKDNQSYGEWDWDLLADNWEQDSLIEWGFEPYNFGAATDFLDMDDETEPSDELPPAPDKPKITDDGYVRYEIVLLEQDKQKVVETLARIRKEQDITLAQAFMFIIHEFNTK